MTSIRIPLLIVLLALLLSACSAITDFSPDHRGGDGGTNNQNTNTNTNQNQSNSNIRSFLIDSDSGDVERSLGVASAPGGRILVVWAARVGVTNDTLTFYGRFYNADGTARSDRFALWGSPIAMLGNLTVTWSGDDRVLVAWSGTAIGDTNHVEARVFDSSGTPRGAAARLNEEGVTTRVAATASSEGHFFVLWNEQSTGSHEIVGRFVNADTSEADGNVLSITSLSDTAMGSPPAVVGMEDGTYFVAWAQGGGAGDDLNIVAKQLDEYGAGTSTVFDVHEDDPGEQRFPAIGRLGSGLFRVVWIHEPETGDGVGIRSRVFDGPGGLVYEEREVQDISSGHVVDSFNTGLGLATTDSGRSVVVWQESYPDGDSNIYTRGYGNADSGGGVIFRMDVSADEPPSAPRVAPIGDGTDGFFVVWRRPFGDLAGNQWLYGGRLDSSFSPITIP